MSQIAPESRSRLKAKIMNAYPSGLVRLTGHHAFDTFAINLGTNLYGMKSCAKTLNPILVAWRTISACHTAGST
jgi:hypothetical protein